MSDATDITCAWRTSFALFGPKLVLFARQWLPDVFDAEDAVQEAFLRFWRKQRPPNENQAGLLFAAVRHAALDHIRRETRRKHRELAATDQEIYPSGSQQITSWFEQSDSGHDRSLQTALQQLSCEQREVLVLKIWGELTFAQIGEALDLSPNTAASRYRYAINALRKILKPVCHE